MSKVLPAILSESVPGQLQASEGESGEASADTGADIEGEDVYPWHHPYKQILPSTCDVSDIIFYVIVTSFSVAIVIVIITS